MNDYSNVALAHPDFVLLRQYNQNFDYLIVGQQFSSKTSPPEVEGFQLVSDHFVRDVPTLLGLKLGRTMPGYGFAVYKARAK